MKRLLIYLTYDRQNIIDDYIGYFLHSMRSIAETIAVVCNMQTIEKGLHNLSSYADDIFYRENVGLDAGGFKDVLCTYIGWEKVFRYDEIILANDSFYGPFEDMDRIFSEMEGKRLDFWGLMKRGAGEYGATGKDPEHILSFFYAFQAPLIHSREFRSYWDNMPYFKDYMTAVKQYERQLTKHFADLGYTYDAYAHTLPNDSKNPKNLFFQCDYLSHEMIAERNFPFLKRKQMSNNTLYCQTQENLPLSMEYIGKNTDYDVDMIWSNLIRTQHHTELQRSLGLQFILPGGKRNGEKRTDVAVCVRVQWMNAFDTVNAYLEKIKGICDIWIIAEDQDIAVRYHGRGFKVFLAHVSDIEILQSVDTDNYRYVCMIHDSDLSSERIPSCAGKSYFFNIWENLIKDVDHIEEIVELLDMKKHVGMLLHPVPVFGIWLGQTGFGWEEKYADVKEWVERLGLNAIISPDTPPINVTDNFWVRSEVIDSLKKRLSSCRDGIPAHICSRLWNYIVQDSGKLTGIVESSFYASLNEPNYHYYLKTFIDLFTQKYGSHQNLHEFRELFRVNSAAEECREKYEKWYVYGTGDIAGRCFEWIRDTAAFIVSDGQQKDRVFRGIPVIYLSELEQKDNIGIVLCLSKEIQNRVIELLEEKGIKNYYAIN